MKVYKIFDETTNMWMKAGGVWTEKEDHGKVWKKLNYAKSALTLQYPKVPDYYKTCYPEEYQYKTERRNKNIAGVKIISYEIKEIERIDYI